MSDGPPREAREARDRAYPKNPEAEGYLLGGLLKDSTRLAEIDRIVDAEDFSSPQHQEIFRAIVELGDHADLVTLVDRASRRHEEERFGGLAYLSTLEDRARSTRNLPHYARLIREKSVLRHTIEILQRNLEAAFVGPHDVPEFIGELSSAFLDLAQGHDERTWQQLSEVMDDALKVVADPDRRPGVPTGFAKLDELLYGLQPSDLIILAARPSMGKTALALNIAMNAALYGIETLEPADLPVVGVFSLEMDNAQLAGRMLCSQALVDGMRLRDGKLTQDEWDRLFAASDRIRGSRLFMFDEAALTVHALQGRARRLLSEQGRLDLIVVDYLQLMQGKGENQNIRTASISQGLKQLAKELHVPVVALSQLSRGVESRADKRPMLSDLRDSGSIEQDADVILFIYRDEYYNKDSTDKGLAEVIVSKQRRGATGSVKLAFRKEYTRFDDLAEEGYTL